MVKVRLTFEQGSNEEQLVLWALEEKFKVLNVSKEYKGRGNSKFSNVYVDLDVKK